VQAVLRLIACICAAVIAGGFLFAVSLLVSAGLLAPCLLLALTTPALRFVSPRPGKAAWSLFKYAADISWIAIAGSVAVLLAVLDWLYPRSTELTLNEGLLITVGVPCDETSRGARVAGTLS
jgi:hypothetical protein